MREFQTLFDAGESGACEHPAYARYGQPLGFPEPPLERPWIFSNFVQSFDGIASFLGNQAAGSHISRSPEDRWLMDLLRTHADAVLLGAGTLVVETALSGGRGPVYEVTDPELLDLRQRVGRGPQTNVFVTGSGEFDPARFRVLDGEAVRVAVVTTNSGAEQLRRRGLSSRVEVAIANDGRRVDLPLAMRQLRRQMGIRYLLCEGGPTLSGYLSRAGLIDERFLTVSPVEVGQMVPPEQQPAAREKANPPRLRPTTFQAPGFTADQAPWWTWLSCRRAEDHQFNRYRRKMD